MYSQRHKPSFFYQLSWWFTLFHNKRFHTFKKTHNKISINLNLSECINFIWYLPVLLEFGRQELQCIFFYCQYNTSTYFIIVLVINFVKITKINYFCNYSVYGAFRIIKKELASIGSSFIHNLKDIDYSSFHALWIWHNRQEFHAKKQVFVFAAYQGSTTKYMTSIWYLN